MYSVPGGIKIVGVEKSLGVDGGNVVISCGSVQCK